MYTNLIAAISTPQWIMIALLAVMVIVLIVLPMFTNKRRNKAVNELHNSLRPGDVIKTVGGIVGTIIAIEEISPVDKQMVVETGTGDNKSTMVFDIQAVYQVISKTNAPAPQPAQPKAEEVAPAVEPQEQAQENEPVAEQAVAPAETTEVKAEEPASEQAATETKTVATAKKTGAKKTPASRK